MWVFSGFNTFQEFLDSGSLSGSNSFSIVTINYIDYGDEDVPHPGPLMDPQAMVTSPDPRQLTIVVTNLASRLNDGGYGQSQFVYELSFRRIAG